MKKLILVALLVAGCGDESLMWDGVYSGLARFDIQCPDRSSADVFAMTMTLRYENGVVYVDEGGGCELKGTVEGPMVELEQHICPISANGVSATITEGTLLLDFNTLNVDLYLNLDNCSGRMYGDLVRE
jgi:hypothetical protein